jgi:hypothetical protein
MYVCRYFSFFAGEWFLNLREELGVLRRIFGNRRYQEDGELGVLNSRRMR